MLIRDCNKMFRKEPHEICGRQSFLNIFPHLLQKKNILEIFLEIFQRFTKSMWKWLWFSGHYSFEKKSNLTHLRAIVIVTFCKVVKESPPKLALENSIKLICFIALENCIPFRSSFLLLFCLFSFYEGGW